MCETYVTLSNVAINITPPLYTVMSKDFLTSEASIGFVTAFSLLVRGFTAIIWGYIGGRKNQKILLLLGTLIWSSATVFGSISKTYTSFFTLQIIASIGLGCIEPLGFSVFSDYISPQRRGIALSLWGISQSWGAGGGILLSGYLGAQNWRLPYIIVASLGFIFAILYLFAYKPELGGSEPELSNFIRLGKTYQSTVKASLSSVKTKSANLWLLIAYFLIRFLQGVYFWLPTLFVSKVVNLGYDLRTSTLIGSLFTSLFSLGIYFSIAGGYVGDLFQRKNMNGRLLLSSITSLFAVPFFVGFFLMPMQNLNIPYNHGVLAITTWAIKSIFTNRSLSLVFFLSAGAVALSSTSIPNWSASVSEINLPENRSTIFGVSSLFGGIGGALGNAMAGLLFNSLAVRYSEPQNYVLGFILLHLLYVLVSFCMYQAMKSSAKDILATRRVLSERANGFAKK